jgi:hypothetical protein
MDAYLSKLYAIALSASSSGTSEAAATIAPGQVIAAGTGQAIATVTLVAPASGMVEVIGSAGPGGAPQTGWTSGVLGLFWNTAGGGIVVGNAIDEKPLNTAGNINAGVVGIATGLTPGVAYDFYLFMSATGGDFDTTGISVNLHGGILARAI